MDFSSALEISGSGLTSQRMRMNAIASNIANIHSTSKGDVYKKKDVVFKSVPVNESFRGVLKQIGARGINKVQVSEVIHDGRPPIYKYDPDHPDANESGYVLYPNINLMEEMANMIQATRSYEANVSAIQATKDMALSALEIGR